MFVLVIYFLFILIITYALIYLKDFYNTTIDELDERILELEAEMIVLQEGMLTQAERIQALDDQVNDVTAQSYGMAFGVCIIEN